MRKKSASKHRNARQTPNSLEFTWSRKEEDRADSEGWNIFHASRDGIEVYEIERNDTNDPPHEKAPYFQWDEDAVAHVAREARRGSAFHRKALRVHRAWRRFWRRDAAMPDSGAQSAPPGLAAEWLDPILVLLASDECSEVQRKKCAAAFESIRQVVGKLARTDAEKRACEMLREYLMSELGDA